MCRLIHALVFSLLYFSFMEFKILGFLGMHRFDNGAAIRGGLLVTDVDTKPLEFRVTAPVCPQRFQEILYGDLLEEHISVELLGLPLVNAIQQKPELLLVRNELFLGLNNKHDIPTLLLLKEDEPLIKKGSSTQPLSSQNANYPSAKICTSGKFESNLVEITEKLKSVFIMRDLMEPFNRLDKACIDVHNRKR